ncbi:phenazine biosynthesis protein phzE [Frankia sp. EI5c]|uniref:chorismate-binding protein n=1 Tax=Frankia sp. EI5c TaxID=683316 RepID=UPI0007C3ADAD|nr:chorismate-binding protein [Frankia sp. EI5c]OAA19674.1 phenazine biosynthesis protein phzE [Frankia sp. EI5c]
MRLLQTLLAATAAGADPGPFALVRREGADHLDVYVGSVETADRLADLPLPPGPAGPRVLALVPYRQLAERGFDCVDDGTPLEYLHISGHERADLAGALNVLPAGDVTCENGRFDSSDDEYARVVEAVLRDEIGRGEGANFVIHRTHTASVVGDPLTAALTVLRRLLVGERGAYWTFVIHTGRRILVGATPERHVTVEDGLVLMNPISGTHRLPEGGPDRAALLRFLTDPKEIDELHMVLDEELKMMARVTDGGAVSGPCLREMTHLVHTEYLLAGRGRLDVRDVLRETMFAPTVTGSPLRNACRVIARHEGRGRRYYAGVLALLGRDGSGRQTLDAPILIRTAEISPAGELRLPVGATLVRHSTPAGETAETHTKAAGVLAALGLRPPARGSAPAPAPVPGSTPVPGSAPVSKAAAAPGRAAGLAADPEVLALLERRVAGLSRFWTQPRPGPVPATAPAPALAGRSVLLVDGEDDFTGMLAHQLRDLGLAVTVRSWARAGDTREFDLVVPGPGPGDPSARDDPKMTALRGLVGGLLAGRRPMLAVCLGHQLLAGLLGLRLRRREDTYQGLAREIDLFGRRCRVGFYSTFTAVAAADETDTPYGPVRLAREEHRIGGAGGATGSAVNGTGGPGERAVHALRGPGFVGLQFHPESVLSADGFTVLGDLLAQLLVCRTAEPAGRGPVIG